LRKQVADLQVRLTELSVLGRLDLLTDGEVALLSHALGLYQAELVPMPIPPRAKRKAKARASK
jgi:hypothetical protein